MDWSELPRELLNLISQQIDTEIDLIRFRSVCSNWRSSSIPNDFHISPFNVPILQDNHTIPISFCYLSKHNFYLIKPQPQQQQPVINRPWLIRVTKSSCGKTKLSQSEFLSTDGDSTTDSFDLPFKVLDFNELSVKLAAGDCFLFPDDVLRSFYDIRAFKQRIYAVIDGTGRTVTVGLEDDPKVQLAAEPLVDCGRGDMKFLLESEGELLLVDIHYDYFEIDVFRLDEKEKSWVEFNNLGDRVLFLGIKYSFSASASDLCVPKGNCVIFIDDIFMEHKMSILHLEDQDGHPSPLSDHPEYYNLFWPPPEWIVKSHVR